MSEWGVVVAMCAGLVMLVTDWPMRMTHDRSGQETPIGAAPRFVRRSIVVGGIALGLLAVVLRLGHDGVGTAMVGSWAALGGLEYVPLGRLVALIPVGLTDPSLLTGV